MHILVNTHLVSLGQHGSVYSSHAPSFSTPVANAMLTPTRVETGTQQAVGLSMVLVLVLVLRPPGKSVVPSTSTSDRGILQRMNPSPRKLLSKLSTRHSIRGHQESAVSEGGKMWWGEFNGVH